MVSGESPFLSPLLPCESAPVWHRRQFQSSQRCGVSITPLAGRSKILLSSLASTFGGASITTWAEVNVIIAHHCVVLNIEEEEPVEVSAGTALGSGIQQTSKLSQQFFDGRSFRHFKSSTLLGPFCGKS